MKKFIHDGMGLRVMRGQENELGKNERYLDLVCPCGYYICAGDCIHLMEQDEALPEGWAEGIGGYYHSSGAEVQRRGEFWAWFPKGKDTCLTNEYRALLEEAMLCAAPRWSMIRDWNGRNVYMDGLQLVYMDGDLWKHNRAPNVFYLTAEAAMLAAERMR
jgi:hypothetical protein